MKNKIKKWNIENTILFLKIDYDKNLEWIYLFLSFRYFRYR